VPTGQSGRPRLRPWRNVLIVKEFAFCDWPEVPVAQG
jgi:hypothetical protein